MAGSHLAVRPDGRLTRPDGRVARLPSGRVGGHDLVPGDEVGALAFAPDGATLYAGSPRVPLQRYVVDPERAVTEVCARTGGAGLTRAQWHTYVPDAPYRRFCGDAASLG
ncbi:hypothetical protein ACWD26_01235 [Streptomyces sp. NPDC002787]